MYISRVEIDYLNRKKSRDLSQLGAFHNWVEKMFPNEIMEKSRSRKLWRVDELEGKKYLLLVSEQKPDINGMELYGVKGSAQTRNYDRFLSELKNDQVVSFRAKLNPLISLSTGKHSGKRGRRVPLIKEKEQMEYLINRSHENGFTIDFNDFYIKESNVEILRKAGYKEKVVYAIYEGRLKITNIDKFSKLLVKGLGKKKAYGCGLVTVIPTE